jgi:hypothetical protein
LYQAVFPAAHGYAVHDVHDRVDNSPRDVAANRGEQKLAHSFFAIGYGQPCRERDREHHDQTKQDLT